MWAPSVGCGVSFDFGRGLYIQPWAVGCTIPLPSLRTNGEKEKIVRSWAVGCTTHSLRSGRTGGGGRDVEERGGDIWRAGGCPYADSTDSQVSGSWAGVFEGMTCGEGVLLGGWRVARWSGPWIPAFAGMTQGGDCRSSGAPIMVGRGLGVGWFRLGWSLGEYSGFRPAPE